MKLRYLSDHLNPLMDAAFSGGNTTKHRLHTVCQVLREIIKVCVIKSLPWLWQTLNKYVLSDSLLSSLVSVFTLCSVLLLLIFRLNPRHIL